MAKMYNSNSLNLWIQKVTIDPFLNGNVKDIDYS